MDTDFRIDYARLCRLAENKNNKEKLLEITKEGKIVANIIEKFSLDRLESEEYFVSLLFYLGMLTIGDVKEGRLHLKIPNYSIRTLYWEYLASYIKVL